jgi:hypothetical protein
MYIERQIFRALLAHKENQKITLLIGARQVGKTTVLQALYRHLKETNRSLFLDLDIYSNFEKVSTYENLMNTLKINSYVEDQKELFFLFLDEFQRYSDISLILKNIADHHPNIKVYASGSSSLMINDKIQESLAGRKRIIKIYPLNFKEYLKFRDKSELIEKLDRVPFINSKTLNQLLPELYTEMNHFLINGGYPEVALSSINDRKEIFASIFDLFIKKDLVDYLKLEKIKNAKLLIQALAVNNGAETKYNSLSQMAGIDEKTVKNYIELLKETFLISVHLPWYTNKNKEIVKMPKIYFIDNGVRNYFINNFNPPHIRNDIPFLFEGYVISELIKGGIPTEAIKFWRTKSQAEIDIIIDQEGQQIPIEIKYKSKISSRDLKGINRFCLQYPNTKKTYLVNLNDNTYQEQTKLLTAFDLDTFIADERLV